jgi:CheY-like chemotaxis protein
MCIAAHYVAQPRSCQSALAYRSVRFCGYVSPRRSGWAQPGRTPVVEVLNSYICSEIDVQRIHGKAPLTLHDKSYDRSTMRPAIRVLLVDDHGRVRAALRDLLESYPNLTLVGEASNGEEAVRLVKELSPSVVVMDINMPKLNGIDATIKIKTSYPHVVIVGLSVSASDAHRRAMTAAGATTLISKYMAVEQLYVEIQAAINGRSTTGH